MSALVAAACVYCPGAYSETEDEFRDFEDVEGRIISGQVVGFDMAEEVVSFKRASDGEVLQVKLTVFSHPDRQYIRNWAAMDGLMKDLKFTASIVSQSDRDLSGGGSQYDIVKTQLFNVQIENRTDHAFGRINMEYCIFYRQGVRKEEGMVYDEGSCYGRAVVELNKEQKEDAFKSKAIKLFSRQSPDSFFGKLNDARGEIRGIWIKARIPLPSGERFTYEYRSSNDPAWEWTTRDVHIGLNAENE